MKPSLFTLIGLGLLAAAPVHAQLVHLTFEAPSGQLKLFGSSPDEPWDTGGLASTNGPVTLDLYFDLGAPHTTDPENPTTYSFSDPTRNYWRVRTQGPTVLPEIDASRPLDYLSIYSGGLNIYQIEPWGLLDLTGYWTTPLVSWDDLHSTDFLPVGEMYLHLEGDSDLFHLPGPGGGLLLADFTEFKVDVIQPVPEPATYALGAAALLGLAILVRRSRKGGLSAPLASIGR